MPIALSRIIEKGFEFHYSIDSIEDEYRFLTIEIKKNDFIVASANFTCDEEGGYCQEIYVDDLHQRQGIGTAIYVLAELLYGCSLIDYWKDNPIQTEAAKKLWAQNDRPFGNKT